ncbi:MAG: hypothetical protein ABFS05_10995 [Bacteroidota bacterium]
MKTHIQTPEERSKKWRKPIYWVYLLLITLFITSCYVEPWYGRDGRLGNAYLAISWVDAEPQYLDAGTSIIPAVFEYGRFYRAWPGFFTMYYDGRFWNGQAYAFYAWEVDYEIWTVAGEPGGVYYDGADGSDNYFTVECSPYGPWVYGPGYKSAALPDGYDLVENTDEKIIITKEGSTFGITLTYKKVDPR